MTVRDILREVDRLEIMAKDISDNIAYISERTTVSDVLDVFLALKEMLLDQKVVTTK